MSSRACFILNTKWVSRMPAQPLGNATALGDTPHSPWGSGERDRDRRGKGGREWREGYLPSAIIELKIVLHKNANCHISCTFLFSFGSHCKLFAAYPVCGIYKALPFPSLLLFLFPAYCILLYSQNGRQFVASAACRLLFDLAQSAAKRRGMLRELRWNCGLIALCLCND